MDNSIIYPGTFDPITNGHVDLIERASSVFSKVIEAVAKNPKKKPKFELKQRIELVAQSLSNNPKVQVEGFSCLLTEFAKQKGSRLILRGLRAVSDFEFEFQLANMNRKLSPTLETIFLTPAEQYSYISSTLVKEIAELGGEVSEFVPVAVKVALSTSSK